MERKKLACDSCVHEDAAFLSAMEIAKKRNPDLFKKQDALDEEKRAFMRKEERSLSLLRVFVSLFSAVSFFVIGMLIYGVIYDVEILLKYLNNAVTLISMLAVMIVLGGEISRYFAKKTLKSISEREYALYIEQKEELKRAGYEMP